MDHVKAVDGLAVIVQTVIGNGVNESAAFVVHIGDAVVVAVGIAILVNWFSFCF